MPCPPSQPAQLAALASGAYMDAGEPIVLLGDSGTGKSHLLIALGLAACEQGRRVRYVTTAQLVNELVEAADERMLSRVVGRYGRLDLLLLDELGYVQIDPAAPNCCSRSSPSGRNGPASESGPICPSANGEPCSPTRGWSPPSSTGSPSTPTSSKPAPSPTGYAPATAGVSVPANQPAAERTAHGHHVLADARHHGWA